MFDTTSDDKDLTRFITKKWIEVYDQTGRNNYNVNNEIRIKTPMLRSDLCDFSDAYIVVEGEVTASFNPRKDDYGAYVFPDDIFPDIIFSGGSNANQITAAANPARTNAINTANNAANDARNLIKGVSFKYNASFINCISKTNRTLINNAEDLDVTMPLYNLLEYSKKYRKTTGSLWNYYRDDPTSDGEINYYLGPNSFDLKSSIAGQLGYINNDNRANKDKIRFVVPLKNLTNFWRSLKMPMNNCKIELILTWSKSCVILSNVRRDVIDVTELNAANVSNVNASAVNVSEKSATFQITDTKLYVPVVTLSKKNDKKLSQQLKSGFKRTVKRNKYRSQMTIQSSNNNLNY